MRHIFGGILVTLFIVALTCSPLWAQATAQISGTVKDQSGAVLPGVEIHMTQTDTGVSRDAVTNETGSYVLTNLPIGRYRMEASLPGFRAYAQTGIVLEVNASCYLEKSSEFATAAAAAGHDYPALIKWITELALERFKK